VVTAGYDRYLIEFGDYVGLDTRSPIWQNGPSMGSIKILGGFVEYIVAVVKHYYLISTSAFLTLVLPWLQHRVLQRPIVQADIQTFIDKYSFWIGLGLLFLATFRAWSEERDAREKAEGVSPEALRRRVEELEERLQGRRITDRQKQQFAETVARLQLRGRTIRIVCYSDFDSEAKSYWGELLKLFQRNEIYVGANSDSYVHKTDPFGLLLVAQDPNNLKGWAGTVAELLRSAQIDFVTTHEDITTTEDWCYLRVGKKPEQAI
jgi:hypothetical protein